MALIQCPECGKQVSDQAMACPECAYPLNKERSGTSLPTPDWKPGVAAVLSLVIPGAGQMYKGQVALGLVLLVMTIIGYIFFILPGIIIHLFVIVTAATRPPTLVESPSASLQHAPFPCPHCRKGIDTIYRNNQCPWCLKEVSLPEQ